ncbi:MAG TPA: peptide deformylase [Ignavibacteria bacterium]|nr:peptide deformylase [Ignavibacteria bacterium]
MIRQLPITTYGMDILRKKTIPVTKADSALIDLVQNMFYTMERSSGVGLAAPQINKSISLAVIDISEIEENKKEKPMILINPVITDSHGEISMEEGCLSIPDVRFEIKRPKEIFLKYHDFYMNEIEVELKGFMSRVAQHEIDHLNGKLFIDYISADQKKEIKKQLAKIKKGKIETDYKLHIHSKLNM